MACQSELLSEVVLEDKIGDIWPEYPCFSYVKTMKERKYRSQAIKN